MSGGAEGRQCSGSQRRRESFVSGVAARLNEYDQFQHAERLGRVQGLRGVQPPARDRQHQDADGNAMHDIDGAAPNVGEGNQAAQNNINRDQLGIGAPAPNVGLNQGGNNQANVG